MARQRWRIRCGSCADDQYVMFLFLLLVIVAITELSSRSFHCWHWSYMKFVVVDVIPYFFFPLFFWRSLRIGLLIKLIGMSFVPLQPLDSERRNPRHLRSERSVPPTPLLPGDVDDGSEKKKRERKKKLSSRLMSIDLISSQPAINLHQFILKAQRMYSFFRCELLR